MARLTGINLAVQWVDASGTLNIPTVRSFTPNINYEIVDYTRNGDSIRNIRTTRLIAEPQMTYINFSGTISGVNGDSIRQRLAAGKEGTLIWGEYGTASGNPKGAIECVIKVNDSPITFDGEVERTIQFLPTRGTFVADPGTAVW